MLRNVSQTVSYPGFTPPQVAKIDNFLLTFFTIFPSLGNQPSYQLRMAFIYQH
jgi:hypothetical protein